MSDPLTVIVVDDSSDIRDLLRLAIRRDDRLDLVAEASDGEEGLRIIGEHAPDIVLLDLSMPVMDGLEVLRSLASDDDSPVIIVLSGFSSGAPEAAALDEGAAGYIEKGLAIREMTQRIIDLYEKAHANA